MKSILNKIPDKTINLIRLIIENLVKIDVNNNIECILLFGSYAKGTYQPHSDIDLCLVVKELPDRLTRNKIYNTENELNIDVDYVICTKDMLSKNTKVYKYINAEGIVIYGNL